MKFVMVSTWPTETQPNTAYLYPTTDNQLGIAVTNANNEKKSVLDAGTLDEHVFGALRFAKDLPIASSDETTPIGVGLKVTFRSPTAYKVSQIKASLTTPQTSGNLLTVDVRKNGTSILSRLITFKNGSDTSKDAVDQPIIVPNTWLEDDAKVTVHVTQVGDGTATGLKVYISDFGNIPAASSW